MSEVYSFIGTICNLFSFQKTFFAICLAVSVFQTPVGHKKRYTHLGVLLVAKFEYIAVRSCAIVSSCPYNSLVISS
jgi:hypothetical protein